jgi:hypothetical protein
VTVKRKKKFSRFAPRARVQGSKVKRETKKHCAFDGCRDGKDNFFSCASRIVPAFKLQQESEKKNECAIDGEEFFFYLRSALCACV